MLEVYNKDGTQKRIVENDDLTLKTDRNVRVINELPVQGSASFFFYVNKTLQIGNVTIPIHSRGTYLSDDSSPDAVLIASDYSGNLYVGFRNNGIWSTCRKI